MRYFESKAWYQNPTGLYPDLLARGCERIDAGRIAIFRYHTIRKLLQHPDISADWDVEKGTQSKPLSSSMSTSDGEQHYRQRKVVAGTYNKQPVQELDPVIRSHVQRLMTNLPKTKGFEFIQGVGKPLTLEIFIELTGLQRTEATKIAEHARKFMSLVGLTTEWAPQAAELRAMREVYENLWNHREEEPPTGLMKQIFNACDADIMSYDEIMEMCVLVSIGTNETMTNLIGLCFMYLEMYPKIREEIALSPDKWNDFIDEVIRIDGPVRSSSAQRAKRAIEIDGITIREGDLVYLVYSVANHDPDAFENPREFNIYRKGAPHLGFGFGRHHCLGSHLAKSTMRIILEELHKQFPDWHMSTREFPWHSRFLKIRHPGPWAFLNWRNSQQIRGLETIHLDFS